MIPYYLDYYWKNGKPLGIKKIDPLKTSLSYRILSDPYHKWISIEKYACGAFQEIVYDSHFLDFRKLKPSEQIAWNKECILENAQCSIAWIRNQDERVILKEKCEFENGLCRKCEIFSPQGTLISVHRMLYKELGDSINGMILLDKEMHPVFFRIYQNILEGDFKNLIKEEWEIKEIPFPHSFKLNSSEKNSPEGLNAQK